MSTDTQRRGVDRTFSSSAILFISASPALPSFLSSFLAKLRVLSRAFCSASLKGGAWFVWMVPSKLWFRTMQTWEKRVRSHHVARWSTTRWRERKEKQHDKKAGVKFRL